MASPLTRTPLDDLRYLLWRKNVLIPAAAVACCALLFCVGMLLKPVVTSWADRAAKTTPTASASTPLQRQLETALTNARSVAKHGQGMSDIGALSTEITACEKINADKQKPEATDCVSTLGKLTDSVNQEILVANGKSSTKAKAKKSASPTPTPDTESTGDAESPDTDTSSSDDSDSGSSGTTAASGGAPANPAPAAPGPNAGGGDHSASGSAPTRTVKATATGYSSYSCSSTAIVTFTVTADSGATLALSGPGGGTFSGGSSVVHKSTSSGAASWSATYSGVNPHISIKSVGGPCQ